MAVNSGEVRVTLTAISREFSASIRTALRQMRELRREAERVNKALSRPVKFPLGTQLSRTQNQLKGIQSSGTGAFSGATTGARNMSQAIDRGNRSLTLMVAKFALVTFAVQTVATIIDSTFGAALRSIDEFEQGIIGTAAAITNLADLSSQPGATFGTAFQQNLGFVRGAFQELEVIAGNFFSTAGDLQLAFNTLAARGVVIRREEFTTLGLITDQIKLQTRGQVSSIQIAQELRNLFTGQVRAADQLGQLIRAQGGDVKAVAKELRETGSLAPLEPFVAGLREALGTIQGLLLPQMARFQAIAEQITRLAFADIFTGSVSSLKELNDVLNDNRAQIGAIANIVFSRLKTAFDAVLNVLKEISPVLAFIAGSSLLRVVGLALRFGFALVTPARVLVFIAAKIIEATVGFETFGRIVESVGGALSSIFGLFLKRLDQVIDATSRLLGVFLKLTGLGNLFEGVSPESVIDGFDAIAKAADRAAGGVSEQKGNVEGFIDGIKNFFTVSEKEIEDTINRLSKQTSDSPFASRPGGVPDDSGAGSNSLLRRILEAQRRLREAEAKRNLKVDENEINQRRNLITQGLANQTQLAREAFEQRRDLIRQETQLQLDAVQNQIDTQNELAREQRARILNDSKLTDTTRGQQIELVNLQTSQRIVNLEAQRLGIQQNLNNQLTQQNVKLAESRRTLDRLLQDQAISADNFFVQTVGDSLDKLIIEQRRRLQDLRRENPSLTDADVDQLAGLNRLEQTQTAIAIPLNAALDSIDQAFQSLVQGIVDGAVDFQSISRNIGQSLLQGGLQDLINGAKEAISEGLTNVFEGLSNEAAKQAAAALAAGIGLLFAVLSRTGNDGSFSASGGGASGIGLASSAPVRGIIGGSSSIPIAEINTGLQEALIPTNNILTAIERNTRAFAGLNIGLTPEDIAATIQAQISDLFAQATLNP